MRSRDRVVIALGSAVVFGLAAGLVHGNDGGLRGAFGNVSAPWLLVALVPGWWAGSALRGAMLGALTTLVALVAFYSALTVEMAGHLGAVHGGLTSFGFVLSANRMWLAVGAVTGPICGGLGGFLGARLRPAWLVAVSGALMMTEIAVVVAVHGVELPVLRMRWGGAADLRGYAVEAVLGALVLAALALTVAARRVRARAAADRLSG